ncbi:diguanylate cyclase domain-containing protein [Pseudomonadota bacterium]
MEKHEDNLVKIVFKSTFLRRIVIVVILASVTVPAYDLLSVYPSFERLLFQSTEREAKRTAIHLANMIRDEPHNGEPFSNRALDKATQALITHSAKDFELWKARIFTHEGEIIFSTLPEEVGNKNTNDYFFNVVAKGTLFSKLEKKQGLSMEGETLPLDVVEIYVPIIEEGTFLGAIEVYYNITEQKESLRTLLLKSGITLVALVTAIVATVLLLLLKITSNSRKLAQARQLLTTQEQIFCDVIDSAQDGIIVTDADQRIKIVNPAFCDLTGYDEQDVLEQTPAMLSSGQHDDHFYEQMWRSIEEDKRWRGEIWNRRNDGSIFPGLLSISTIEDDSEKVTHYVGIFTDISQQKASEKHYQDMAYHDPLTGLANRLLFLDSLRSEIREAKRSNTEVALLFLDLDGFKQVNDTAGHDVGDILLKQVARRLLLTVRSEDTVARIGGDEFTIVLKTTNNRDAIAEIGNKLVRVINKPILINDTNFHVGACIGIACYPHDAEDAETLITIADEAMYEAKQTGKNRVITRWKQ